MSAPERAAPTFATLFARDLAIVAALVAVWWLAARFSAGQGPVADLCGVAAGVALGLGAFPLHEWGHFLGARATRSVVRPAESLRSFFAFSFDSRANSLRQFVATTLGGWAGTAAAVWIAYGLLPPELLATRVARGTTLVAVLLVVVTEIPLLARAYWTGRIPPVETVGSRGRSAAPVALVLLVGVVACTTPVPPTTRVLGLIDPKLDRVLYVMSNAEHENVVADLRLAGFETTPDARRTPLVLVVKLGGVRRSADCGTLRNVSYQLRQQGVVVAVIKARGWIGSCHPSILGGMNAELARLFDAKR